jgi:methylmalonyl-CoA mutase N-terminal domain/subunit
VEEVTKAGVPVDEFGPHLAFYFVAQADLFEEVAKFRAARRLWAQLMRERYQARDPRSWMLRFHTQTAGVALTAQQPENNVVRVTIQALAAILGGTQSLHTNAMDEALALPTDESALLALRTQQVIAQETGAADTVDPLGGAYFIEARTAAIEAQAASLIRQIENAGGVLRALETGFIQRQIADAAYRESQRIERGEQIVVGVNRYQTEGATRLKILQVAPEVVGQQRTRLARVRRDRDGEAVDRALQALSRAAAGGDNLMPVILDAVRAYATVGEICDTLRTVFGVHRPTLVV